MYVAVQDTQNRATLAARLHGRRPIDPSLPRSWESLSALLSGNGPAVDLCSTPMSQLTCDALRLSLSGLQQQAYIVTGGVESNQRIDGADGVTYSRKRFVLKEEFGFLGLTILPFDRSNLLTEPTAVITPCLCRRQRYCRASPNGQWSTPTAHAAEN